MEREGRPWSKPIQPHEANDETTGEGPFSVAHLSSGMWRTTKRETPAHNAGRGLVQSPSEVLRFLRHRLSIGVITSRRANEVTPTHDVVDRLSRRPPRGNHLYMKWSLQ